MYYYGNRITRHLRPTCADYEDWSVWDRPVSDGQARFFRDLAAGRYDKFLLRVARRAPHDCTIIVKDDREQDAA
jgi:hypothetical protein